MTSTMHAPDIGGFADAVFLEVVQRHHPVGVWQAIETDDSFVPLVVSGSSLSFAGHEDLVDYRAPVGPNAAELLGDVLAAHAELTLRVDSLPAEAADTVAAAARLAGREPRLRPHQTTARLAVAEGFEGYLAALSKKERHELRRKRRRYEEELGSVAIVRESAPGRLLEEFVRLHRSADGDKGEFMTDSMAGYFEDVLLLDGWHVDALVERHDRVAAAAFAYEDDRAYYLYNSGYDQDLRHVSPGIVLLGALIERTADSRQTIFDFLKGDEAYKYRLGAESRQLYEVSA